MTSCALLRAKPIGGGSPLPFFGSSPWRDPRWPRFGVVLQLLGVTGGGPPLSREAPLQARRRDVLERMQDLRRVLPAEMAPEHEPPRVIGAVAGSAERDHAVLVIASPVLARHDVRGVDRAAGAHEALAADDLRPLPVRSRHQRQGEHRRSAELPRVADQRDLAHDPGRPAEGLCAPHGRAMRVGVLEHTSQQAQRAAPTTPSQARAGLAALP
jgi:hypothetical protein